MKGCIVCGRECGRLSRERLTGRSLPVLVHERCEKKTIMNSLYGRMTNGY